MQSWLQKVFQFFKRFQLINQSTYLMQNLRPFWPSLQSYFQNVPQINHFQQQCQDYLSLNFDYSIQLMIKGKKIEAVNFQLLSTNKNGIKQGGFAIGKDFMLEKKQIVNVAEKKDNQNEENLLIASQQELEDKLQHVETRNAPPEPAKFQQNKHKSMSKGNEQLTKFNPKAAKNEKQSKERSQNKKQNKMMNSKSTKQIKGDLRRQQMLQKTTKIEQKKPNLPEAIVKKVKSPIPVVPKQHPAKTITKHQPQYQNHKKIKSSQEIQFEEQMEQERIQSPNPIIQSGIQPSKDYMEQISFGNHQQQSKLPQHPIKYESSDDEDFRQSHNIFCITQNDESERYEENGELCLNSELFALTAEQLLAKEYFNL